MDLGARKILPLVSLQNCKNVDYGEGYEGRGEDLV